MTGLPVQRYNYRRSGGCSRVGLGCGCFIGIVSITVFACAGLYAAGILTPIIFQLLGAERIDETDALFSNGEPPPTQEIDEPILPNVAVIDLGEFGRQTINTDADTIQVVTGSDDIGLPVAQMTISEAGLLALCRQRTDACASGTEDAYRNVRFDLRSGGMVVYVDLRAGPVWQRVGLVMRVGGGGQLDVIGVDVDGTTYNPQVLPSILPADLQASIVEGVAEIERVGRDLLTAAALDMGDRRYRIQTVATGDMVLTITLR